jgi:Family of unknown function (DUF5895)
MKPIKQDEQTTAITPAANSGISIDDLLFGLPDFTEEQYIDRSAKVPRITALRGELDPNCFGLFVKVDDAAEVELQIPEGMEPIEYTYNNGDTAVGYMFKTGFGLCVQPLTPLLAFSRQTEGGEKQEIVEYNSAEHGGNPNYTAGKIYDILLVVGGKLLHQQPLRLTIKGAASATFAKAWDTTVQQVGRAYCKAKDRTYRPMNWEFNRLVVFKPVMARELAGTANKSAALVFKDSAPATLVDNFMAGDQYSLIAQALIKPEQQAEQSLLVAAEDYVF